MEKTVFEMTQQELIELNSQYLKRIQELEEALNIYLQAGHKEARREASVIAKKALNKPNE